LVRLRRGRYECAQCGTVLDVDRAKVPRVLLEASSGQPVTRILLVDGQEIHRCVVGGPPAQSSS
jgi:hypothetical protein